MLASAQGGGSSRGRKPPTVSTVARGPLSLSEPQKNLSQTDTAKVNFCLPQLGIHVSEPSLAEEVLLSYTGSPYHCRPPNEHSLTGLPGLVKRPADDLTDHTLADYGQKQLVDQAMSIHPGHFPEKKTFTLPEFHPMMKYSPHAPFMTQQLAKRHHHRGQHRKALSAPGKYWSPQAAENSTAFHLASTACYMRKSFSAGGPQYGGWLGISQLKRHPRTGVTLAGIEVVSSTPRVAHSAGPGSKLEGHVPEACEELTINQLTGEECNTDEGNSSRQKGEVKTGHVLLAPPSLDAVYVHRYHPVTTHTFLKGKVAAKSPRTVRARWTGKNSHLRKNK